MFLTLFPSLHAQEVQHEEGPQIFCEAPNHDFGIRNSGTIITHSYFLQNIGNEELIIRHITPSCGCTITEIQDKNLSPGEHQELKVQIDLKGKKSTQNYLIMVQSNDPDDPILFLNMQGIAVTEVTLHPNPLNFGNIGENERAEETVELLSNQQMSIEITGFKLDSDLFSARVVEEEKNRKNRIIIATVPPLPRGLAHANMMVYTNRPSFEETSLSISANVVGKVVFQPLQLIVAAGESNTSHFIIISAGTAKSIDVLGVKLPTSRMKAQIIRNDKKSSMIKISELIPSKDLDGKNIEITVLADEKIDILIPIKVFQFKNSQ
jgi:hypothetical protein